MVEMLRSAAAKGSLDGFEGLSIHEVRHPAGQAGCMSCFLLQQSLSLHLHMRSHSINRIWLSCNTGCSWVYRPQLLLVSQIRVDGQQVSLPEFPDTRAVLKTLPASESFPGAQYRLAGDRWLSLVSHSRVHRHEQSLCLCASRQHVPILG